MLLTHRRPDPRARALLPLAGEQCRHRLQPWPEEALASVSKRFLDGEDLGTEEAKQAIINFMPYSLLAVDKVGDQYQTLERRFN